MKFEVKMSRWRFRGCRLRLRGWRWRLREYTAIPGKRQSMGQN